MENEHLENLYLELTSLEDRGITIWLEGAKSDSEHVSTKLCINEENSYMRDYVFDKGVLTEIRFDKINRYNK